MAVFDIPTEVDKLKDFLFAFQKSAITLDLVELIEAAIQLPDGCHVCKIKLLDLSDPMKDLLWYKVDFIVKKGIIESIEFVEWVPYYRESEFE